MILCVLLFLQLLIPYIDDGHMTRMQRHHNYFLSSSRAAIERSFALLRGKNRRLKKLPMRNRNRLVDHVSACFVLHNVILLGGIEARVSSVSYHCNVLSVLLTDPIHASSVLQGLPDRPMAVADNVAQLEELTARSGERGALKREYVANLLRPAEQ